MKWLRLAVRRIDASSEVIAKAASWLVMVMMSITVFDVVLRYFFDAPTIWAYELSGLLLAPFWLLGGAYVLSQNFHVRMDVFYRRLTPRRQAILDLVTHTFFFFYCSLIVIGGWDYFWTSFIRDAHSWTLWRPVLWPFRMFIPIGFGLALLAGIVKYIRDLYIAIPGKSLS